MTTHYTELFNKLAEYGFEPQIDPENQGLIILNRAIDVTNPAKLKSFKVGLPLWLEIEKPQSPVPAAGIGAGVTLKHEDMRRTLYYLGKAVGTEDALNYFKQNIHAMHLALHFFGLIATPPLKNWEDVELDNAFPSGW